MTVTVISPQTYSEEEHNIAATFSPPSVAAIVRLQQQLKAVLGDIIWLTPANCLHSTLMEIICDVPYVGDSRSEYFQEWYKSYNELTQKIIAGFPPFLATFNTVQVSPGAIIIKAADPTPFNKIREALLAKVRLPHGTKMPPTIAHCSIARYNTAVNLARVQHQTQHMEIGFTENITSFSLIKDLVPPQFDPRVLETYHLAGHRSQTSS